METQLVVLTNKEITKKLDVSTKFIKEMAAQADTLTISGVDDKVGYENVHTALRTVKAKISGVKKTKIDLKAPYLEVNKVIEAEFKRLNELLTPIKDKLTSKKKEVDDEIEARREAKRLAKKKLFDDRMEKLSALPFVEVTFTVVYCGNASVAVHNISELSEDEFDESYDEFKEESNSAVLIQQEKEAKEKAIADAEAAQRKKDMEELAALRKAKAEAEKAEIEAKQTEEDQNAKNDKEEPESAEEPKPTSEAKKLQTVHFTFYEEERVKAFADSITSFLSKAEIKELKKLI